jgi:hypothetical protein
MKQPVVVSEPETNPDLQCAEEVAALVPEEARAGRYPNVCPWLRKLPPDDEAASRRELGIAQVETTGRDIFGVKKT